MNLAVANFWKHPQSSIKALLGLGIAITIGVLALPPKAGVGVIILAVLRAVLGFMQKDVGREEAVLPGQPAPQMVAAHETPNQAGAEPVEKEQ